MSGTDPVAVGDRGQPLDVNAQQPRESPGFDFTELGYAGARALLVSHWAVQSEAAVELTTRTFATLAREPRLGRAEAFRRTMLAMIDAGKPPMQWAPFIIVGEGGPGR